MRHKTPEEDISQSSSLNQFTPNTWQARTSSAKSSSLAKLSAWKATDSAAGSRNRSIKLTTGTAKYNYYSAKGEKKTVVQLLVYEVHLFELSIKKTQMKPVTGHCIPKSQLYGHYFDSDGPYFEKAYIIYSEVIIFNLHV